MGAEKPDSTLRAKYLDWCSARIAERFLAMSPDEIYQRAEQATLGRAHVAGPQASLSPSVSENQQSDWRAVIESTVTAVAEPNGYDAVAFRALVSRVTEVLADELELPTFEEWSAAYSEAPGEFDSEMLGFWRDGLN